ncbi:peroxidase 1-like [Oryza brachyantha]|uniref:Peroxidase n=1 Tax=Oryza brachyantha TaxID=4533 RepID=J3MI05_ORYBR|nr:peroxidase 1-like [Oryza brachyantha]
MAAGVVGLRGIAVAVVVVGLVSSAAAHVFVGAYNKTCPQAEEMVYKEMTDILGKSPEVGGAILRLFSVDCFVGGCEGSILLNSTPGHTAEKDSPLNKGVRGYEVVDAIKAKLDAACPGIVSCSDTLALAARDAVRLRKGPYIPLPTGRRDGNTSNAADVGPNSPAPGATVSDLLTLFAKFNFTAKDLVVLSGAHTIGKAHCSTISPRLYGNASVPDPPLDANYTAALRGLCKPGDADTLVDLDPGSPATFDTDYYKQVATQRGLLSTDAALLLNADTRAYVLRQANATSDDEFFSDFIVSFVNMSKIGVLTHSHGEIRQKCSAVNPPSSSPSTSAAAIATSLAGSLLFLLAGALVLLF